MLAGVSGFSADGRLLVRLVTDVDLGVAKAPDVGESVEPGMPAVAVELG